MTTKPAQLAPLWKLGRVSRKDAGGTLYNAIHVSTGREFWGIPSYDGDAILRRVDKLNAEKVACNSRAKPADPYRALQCIFDHYDGKECESETHDRVREELESVGYWPRDPHEVEECVQCHVLVDATHWPKPSHEHASDCSLYVRGGNDGN